MKTTALILIAATLAACSKQYEPCYTGPVTFINSTDRTVMIETAGPSTLNIPAHDTMTRSSDDNGVNIMARSFRASYLHTGLITAGVVDKTNVIE